MEEFSYKDLQTATQDFSLSRLIGKGSHGCVYKGILKETGKLIAVKKPSLALQILQDNSKLDNEIDILSSLETNPYLVNPVGLSHDSSTQKKKLLVMEFMSNGSLHDYLHNSSTPPSWSKRAHMAFQIARAVQFLHESKPSIIHRDIKSANVLFDSNWNARLADFGLAVRQHDSNSPSQKLSQPAGTIGYLDPCYTTPGKLSTKNDVFSFGVLLLEIISCRRAIDVRMDPTCIVDWALPLIDEDRTAEICDARVGLSTNMEGVIGCILNIAARCVSSKEDNRPSMNEIITELKNYVVEERIRIPIWRSLLWNSYKRRRRRRNSAIRITTIKCTSSTTHEVDVLHVGVGVGVGGGKVTLREVLAETLE